MVAYWQIRPTDKGKLPSTSKTPKTTLNLENGDDIGDGRRCSSDGGSGCGSGVFMDVFMTR